MHDDVVPPVSGHMLARAFAAPHLEPRRRDRLASGGHRRGTLVGNGPDGETVAFFQFEVTRNGETGPAYHVATPSSDEGAQLQHFLETWAVDGIPEVVDPYRVLSEDAD